MLMEQTLTVCFCAPFSGLTELFILTLKVVPPLREIYHDLHLKIRNGPCTSGIILEYMLVGDRNVLLGSVCRRAEALILTSSVFLLLDLLLSSWIWYGIWTDLTIVNSLVFRSHLTPTCLRPHRVL